MHRGCGDLRLWSVKLPQHGGTDPSARLCLYNVDTQVIHDGAVIRTAVIFFYLANEGLSILENSAIIGLPVPDKLKDMLLQLAEEEHPKDEGDTENSETVEAEASTNPTEADIDDAAEKDSNNK